MTPRLLPLGDAAWTVEFGDTIDLSTHARVMGFARALQAARDGSELAGVIEWVPTFRSCSVLFDPMAIDADALADRLRDLAVGTPANSVSGRRWRIPILFGGDAGPDLAELAKACARSPKEVIDKMASTVFGVPYMLGFMPGFPYMGGLPEELAMPRLATPRKVVPARSLAVTGALCAIYPVASPGGWRLLGRTPLPLFDVGDAAAPALFSPGDNVMWQPIDADTFAQLERDAGLGRLSRTHFQVAPEMPWPS